MQPRVQAERQRVHPGLQCGRRGLGLAQLVGQLGRGGPGDLQLGGCHFVGLVQADFELRVRERTDALFVGLDPFLNSRRVQLAQLATHHRIPAVYSARDIAEAGGLMSYGTNITDAFRQVGVYTGRILKGAKPDELPVQAPVKFVLTINLRTAKSIGLEVPLHLQQHADEMIE